MSIRGLLDMEGYLVLGFLVCRSDIVAGLILLMQKHRPHYRLVLLVELRLVVRIRRVPVPELLVAVVAGKMLFQ